MDLIRSAGSISRAELTSLTGLTQPAISTIVKKLINDDLIREVGHSDSTGGKRRRLLAMNSVARFGVGMQLGPQGLLGPRLICAVAFSDENALLQLRLMIPP